MIPRIDRAVDAFFESGPKAVAILILTILLCFSLLRQLDQQTEIQNLNYKIKVLSLACAEYLL